MGGLGNQLFQIFATISYGIKSKNQFILFIFLKINSYLKVDTFGNPFAEKVISTLSKLEAIITNKVQLFQNAFFTKRLNYISSIIVKNIIRGIVSFLIRLILIIPNA
jgi:hypothetical protein